MDPRDSESSEASSDDDYPVARRELFENRTDDKIRVFSRLRPCEASPFTVHDNELCMNEEVRGVTKTISYVFSGIFQNTADQVEVFDSVAVPAISKFLLGESVLLFSYGTTSSGKTYTVQGTGREPGLIPRTLFTLFCNLEKYLESNETLCPNMYTRLTTLPPEEVNVMDEYKHAMLVEVMNLESEGIDNITSAAWDLRALTDLIVPTIQKLRIHKNYRYSVWVTFSELYQENIYDLLDVQKNISSSNAATDKRPRLNLGQEHNTKYYYVKGLKHFCVRSWVEALRLFLYGRKRLHVNETILNRSSSRSHSVFTIKIVAKSKDGSAPLKISSFAVCDLAGCERSKKLKVSGQLLKEANHINMSIMVLNRCLEVLRNNQKQKTSSIVPYRDSKLTKIFQKSLTSGEDIIMIVNISQDPELLEESRQVLRASSIAQDVKLLNPNKYIPKNPRVSELLFGLPAGISVDAISLSNFSNDPGKEQSSKCSKCQELAIEFKEKEMDLLNQFEKLKIAYEKLEIEKQLKQPKQLATIECNRSPDLQTPMTSGDIPPALKKVVREEVMSYIEELKEKDILIAQQENEIENLRLKLAVYERASVGLSNDTEDETEAEDTQNVSMFSRSEVVVSSTLLFNQPNVSEEGTLEPEVVEVNAEAAKKWNLRQQNKKATNEAANESESIDSSDDEFKPRSVRKPKSVRGKVARAKPNQFEHQYPGLKKDGEKATENSGNPRRRRQLYTDNVDEVTDLLCDSKIKTPEISPLSELRRQK